MTKILSCAAVLGLLVTSSSGVLAKGPGGPSGSAPQSPRDINQPAALLPLELPPDFLERRATRREDCTTPEVDLPEARAHRFMPPAS